MDVQSDILESLGLSAQGGYNTPGDVDMPTSSGPASSEGALEQAKVLARLQHPQEGFGSKLGNGFGAKNNKTPGNKWAALLDGGMTGFSGARGASATAERNRLLQTRQQMQMLKELFGMDRMLRRDRATDDYRQKSLDLQHERNQTRGTDQHYRDPISVKKDIDEMVNKHRAQKALDEDDAISSASSKKLKPEARKALEEERDTYRKSLEDLAPSLRKQRGSEAPVTPVTPVTPPDRAKPSIDGLPTALTPPTPDAQPPKKVRQIPMTPPAEPTIEPPAAQNTPTPPMPPPAGPDSIVRPPPRPKTVGNSPFTMEQIIADGRRRVIEEGRDPKEVAEKGSKAFGVELSPDLFTPPPPPAAPQPGVDPTAIESGNVPTGAPSMGPMDFIRSLFGS